MQGGYSWLLVLHQAVSIHPCGGCSSIHDAMMPSGGQTLQDATVQSEAACYKTRWCRMAANVP